MGLAIVNTCTLVGMEALGVTVEVHLANGLPAFAMVLRFFTVEAVRRVYIMVISQSNCCCRCNWDTLVCRAK